MARDIEGNLWTWGDRGNLSTKPLVKVIEPFPWLTDIIDISSSSHTLAIGKDKSVWGWGNNYSFQLARYQYQTSWFPVPIEIEGLGDDIVQVAAGGGHKK